MTGYRRLPDSQNKNTIKSTSRAIAKQWDEEFYFTGFPCKRGHISKRFTKNTYCKECYDTIRKDARHSYFIKSKYKITPEQYKEMLANQNGVCAICGQNERVLNPVGAVRMMSVDHCHDSGKVRGLLCSLCNVAIGNLKHDPELLRKAALYCE